MLLNKKSQPSLKSRYISLSLALGLIVIAFVTYTYFDLSQRTQLAEEQQKELDHHIALINQIKSRISSMFRAINLYLLEPVNKTHVNAIFDSLSEAQYLSEGFHYDEESIKEHKNISNQLSLLHQHLYKLVSIRDDPNRQFPGMSISANIMAVQQDFMKTQLKILQDEIEHGGFSPVSKSLYADILKTRIILEKTISQTRIYIANRLALFSTNILTAQEKSLIDFYRQTMLSSQTLNKAYQNEQTSFEGLEASAKLISTLNEWYQNFSRLRDISHSDKWRADTHFMKTTVIPLIDEISNDLNRYGTLHTLEKETINEQFKTNNDRLFFILIIIIGLFLGYIFVLMTLMEILVFRPISDIANVMKLKAFGHTNKQFSSKQSKETQTIVNAFNTLENMVSEKTQEMQMATEKAIQSTEEAKLANQAKSIFLANMSHELRTPLHGILSFADLGSSKAEHIEKEKAKQYFDLIIESGQRLLLLLNDLLDLEKLEAGRVEMQMEKHNLQATTETAIKQMKALINKKNLNVNLKEADLPDTTIYDNEKILQVIHNLLTNAIKFTPDNGNIDIYLRRDHLDDMNMVSFTIKDNGVGIPDDELDFVFDKFAQSSKTQTGAGGTGLGLAICHEIIKAHHGMIYAEKTDDTGACLVFKIPAITNPHDSKSD